MKEDKRNELNLFAAQLRLESILSMASCGSGHVGGVLSAAELVAVLYGDQARYRPAETDATASSFQKATAAPYSTRRWRLRGFSQRSC